MRLKIFSVAGFELSGKQCIFLCAWFFIFLVFMGCQGIPTTGVPVCSVTASGKVTLEGQSDHSGIRVTLVVGYPPAGNLTSKEGSYAFEIPTSCASYSQNFYYFKEGYVPMIFSYGMPSSGDVIIPDQVLKKNIFSPLSVGNIWTYKSSFDNSSKEVKITEKKTVSIEGGGEASITYLYTFDFYPYEFGYSSNSKFSLEPEYIIKRTEEGKESVWYKFNAAVGDSWAIQIATYNYQVKLQSTTETVSVTAGTFNNCYKFSFTTTDVSNRNFDQWFCPNVGLTKTAWYGNTTYSDELVSATIDSITIPTSSRNHAQK